MNNPPRILVVDDNATNRDILTTRLKAHGYEKANFAPACARRVAWAGASE
jgi:CheY-like chemotaxis protein